MTYFTSKYEHLLINDTEITQCRGYSVNLDGGVVIEATILFDDNDPCQTFIMERAELGYPVDVKLQHGYKDKDGTWFQRDLRPLVDIKVEPNCLITMELRLVDEITYKTMKGEI